MWLEEDSQPESHRREGEAVVTVGVPPTMVDVARRAGVSTATVSRVLNGSAQVSEETARRVREAIVALNYVPDAIARGLVTGKTQTIGVIVNTISNPFYSTIVRGIEETARHEGFSVLLCNTNYEPATEIAMVRMFAERRADGIVSVGSWAIKEYEEVLPRLSQPVVFINHEWDEQQNPGFPSIHIDNTLGGMIAARHVVELGHRRIAYLAADPIGYLGKKRINGLIEVLVENHIEFDPGFLFRCDGLRGAEAGIWGAETALRSHPRPTALFCYSDVVAFGAMGALKAAGVRVPEDISVMGFDGTEIARYMSLTTVRQPLYEMGKLAAQIVLGQGQEETDASFLELTPELLRGGSTGPCPDR